MRWSVFIITAMLVIAFDTSFGSVLAIGATTPQLSPLLCAFVAMAAPRMTAMWACLLLGLVLDLCDPALREGARPLHLVGPHALGYFFAANLILPLRTMVFRRNPLTLGVLSALFAIAASLVIVMIWTVRSWYPDAPIIFGGETALSELTRSALRALYSGLLAVPVGWMLVKTVPFWGFSTHGQRLPRW